MKSRPNLVTNGKWSSKFIALARSENRLTGEVTLGPTTALGYAGLSLFKLYRNARKAAGSDGFVVRLELGMLPFVAAEATDDRVDGGNDLDDESFAERQMLFWEQELQRIRRSILKKEQIPALENVHQDGDSA